MLEVQDLHAYYGKSHVLQGVNLHVKKGEIVSLLGRNGVGRSTTANAIMGNVARHGSVKFKGEELIDMPSYQIARKGLGIILENRDIFPTLTVRENLILGIKDMRNQGRWTMDDMFDMFSNLKERADVAAGALSGGEQQMLTMCRTLMGDPDLVIVDEPTEGLAPKIVAKVAELLDEMAKRGVSILLVEQKLTIALKIAQRVYVMGHGHVVFEGTPDEFNADDKVRQEWLEV
ncbi:MAG: ABC transporter ATP-binding protein [Methyloligellaceae bacterium]